MEFARESIFVSSLRSFCRCFFAVFGIFLSIMLVTFLYSIVSAPKGYEEKTQLTVLPDLAEHRDLLSTSSPVILRVNIHGIIGEPGMDSETIENILLDSHTGLLTGDRVKGVLLHFNTPGGVVVDADNIYRMLKAYKEKYHLPVYGFVDGLCASGGMYISCCADQIYATPPSVIGSIGVIIGPFFNFSDAMGKIGIQSQTLTQGLDKDMLSPFRTWKENEDASLKVIIASMYNRFVDLVAANRPRVDKTKLVNEYGAQVYDGKKAQEIGYIDVAEASYNEVLAALMKEAKIDTTKPYQVVELKPRTDWISMLASNKSPLFTGKIEHIFNGGDRKSSSVREQFSYYYEPVNSTK